MKRSLTSAAAASTLAVILAAPAAWAGATHEFVPVSYDASEHFEAGEGFCVPWSGTFREVQEGGFRYLTPEGGQVAGEVHVNGVIDGSVTLTPDDPSLPTYSGSYREKTNGIVVGVDASGWDVLRVGQFRLTAPLAGTDGSRIEISLSGKLTVNANGVTTVSRDAFSCG
jgi:hypothetical protein